ncbi:MAG TPA: UvrD-helicase domain-containing protein, partial [Anaeromyxobacteraceae bacterium]
MTPAFGEAARALFRLTAHTAVEAGAGSGKTTCLVELGVRLLSGEATGAPLDPSAVVAITFTEKAAQELAERLRGAVAARGRASPPGSEEGRAWLARLASLDRLQAGTIHAFAAGLLREHAPEAGVDPDFAQLDEEAADELRRAAARTAVVAALQAGRPAARELAAVHGAGGGRGGRGGLAELVAELCRERASRGLGGPAELPPDRSPEALAAREELIAAGNALAAAAGDARTAAMRRATGPFAAAWRALGAAERDGPLDAGARRRLLEAAEAAGGRAGKAGGERMGGARDALLGAAGRFGALSAEALGRAQAEELRRLLAEAEAGFAEAKRRARALDFDDLLAVSRDLLRRDVTLLAELRQRLRALLVDEAQDVNPVQQEIADLLCGPEGPGRPGPPATLVAVGDPKQSIYRFRGAEVAVFRGLVARMAAGEGRVLRLAENHRSSPAVLGVVNAVSARALQPPALPARPFEIAFGDADRLVPVRRGGLAPACEILEDGGEGRAHERRGREARAVAGRIAALVSGAAGVSIPGPSGPRTPAFGDVAVLFRRLTQVAEYERALREAGVPCRLSRGGGFWRAPEVRDLGELLASLFDPGDAIAWAALLRSPLCGLTDTALALVAGRAGGLGGLWRRGAAEAARELEVALEANAAAPPAKGPGEGEARPTPAPAAEARRLRRFLEAWRALREARDRLPPGELLAQAADRLDLEAALLAAPDGERRRANLRKALALARRHAASGGTARGLAERVRALARLPQREPEAEADAGDAVALLSVHQAKGLEWPVVFVADMGAAPRNDVRRALVDGSGRLCAAWADAEEEASELTASLAAAREEERRAAAAESRRLLYVALTRARDRLVLSGSPGRGVRGTWRELVEAGLEGRPDLVVRPAGADGDAAPVAAMPEAPPAGREEPPRLAGPAPLAAVRAAVTDLAEYARCPVRHFLSRRLRLPERPSPAAAPGDGADRATARGTLAHAVLAELDLAATPIEQRAQLAAAARRRGLDPGEGAARRVLADVS